LAKQLRASVEVLQADPGTLVVIRKPSSEPRPT